MIIYKQSTNYTSIKNRLRCYATSVLMINAVVFPESHVSHHVLDYMCLNREGPTLYIEGGGMLLQVHFKMCI